jgi:hypothetical protein
MHSNEVIYILNLGTIWSRTLVLVVQELLLLHFENLILKILVELILLVAFTRSGHTYDKMHKINTMHSTKIFNMTCMNVKNNLWWSLWCKNQLKRSYGLQVMDKLINMISSCGAAEFCQVWTSKAPKTRWLGQCHPQHSGGVDRRHNCGIGQHPPLCSSDASWWCRNRIGQSPPLHSSGMKWWRSTNWRHTTLG